MKQRPEWKFVEAVYKYCHIARNPSCMHVHEDWMKEFLEIEAQLVDSRAIPNRSLEATNTNP